LVEVLVADNDGVESGLVGEGEVGLAQDADAQALGDVDRAGGRLGVAGEDHEEGGFAGAVGTDQAVTVAGGQLDGDVFEEGAFAVGEGEVFGGDHKGFGLGCYRMRALAAMLARVSATSQGGTPITRPSKRIRPRSIP